MYLKDEILTLRAPEKSDLDCLYRWENDSSLWHVGNAVAPYSRKQLWDYVETYDADIFSSRQLRFMIVENSSGECVGTVDLFDFDPVNRHVSVGILIDEKYRRKGCGARALNMVCVYVFEQLGVHTLMAVCERDNEAAVELFKSCGFTTAGCLRSWVRRGSSYSDAIILQRLSSL